MKPMIEQMNQSNTNSTIEGSSERPARRRSNQARWTGGVLLIAIGSLLLLQNQGLIGFTRSWSLLIMIPAIAAFTNVWLHFRIDGTLAKPQTVTSLMGGVVLTTVTIVLFFNLQWEVFGPAILLIVGTGLLFRSLLDNNVKSGV
jgi:hypothetical protein